MSLITIAAVKSKFAVWNKYCNDSETELQSQIDDSEGEFLFYVDVDEDTITVFLTFLLMCIIKKHCFDLLNGDKEFEHKPQIIKDYERALEILMQVKNGEISITGTSTSQSDSITMTTEEKVFDSWFNKNSGEISQMEDQYNG